MNTTSATGASIALSVCTFLYGKLLYIILSLAVCL